MTSLFALGIYKILLAPGQCNMKKLPQPPQNQMAKISPKSDATTYILHIFVENNSRRRGTIVVEKKSQLLTKRGCVFFVSSSNSPCSGHAVQPLDLPSGCWLDEKMLRNDLSESRKKRRVLQDLAATKCGLQTFKLLLPVFRSWRLPC
jgi:hypothetical protein